LSPCSTRPPPAPTLLPYTTLFRSLLCIADRAGALGELVDQQQRARQQKGKPWRHAGDIERAQQRRRMRRGNEQERARQHQRDPRSEEHTSELQSRENLVCRLLLEK